MLPLYRNISVLGNTIKRTAGLSYWYNDGFTIADTAPTDNPHNADILGTVSTTDPASINFISPSTGLNWPTFRNGTFWRSSSTLTRTLGLGSYNKLTFINNGSGTDSIGMYMGFFDSTHTNPVATAGIRILPGSNINQPRFATGAQFSASDMAYERGITDGQPLEIFTVLFSAGSALWVKGGTNFPQWTLVGIDNSITTSNLNYDMSFIGGFDATFFGTQIRAWRVVKPDTILWTSDHAVSTLLSATNGYSATLASAEDAISFKIATLPPASASHRFIFRYVDANNYAFIDVLPSGTNNVQFKEVRLGVTTAVLAQTTGVAGDNITMLRNNPLSNTRRNIFRKNGATISAPNAVATSPNGTSFQVTTTNGGGTFTWVKSDPQTVVNTTFLTYLNTLASGG